MALIGTYEILKMNTWHIKPRPVRLVVGQPIATTGLKARDTESLTAKAREVIAALCGSAASAPHDQNPKRQEPD
jgi:1-acyl-sn-glycerol-3-phosphate acyltransferase